MKYDPFKILHQETKWVFLCTVEVELVTIVNWVD